jgi:hypothetical protein
MADFDWLLLMLAAVSPPEQLSALRTLYIGFTKTMLKKKVRRTWDSASLRAKTLREIKENMGQWESKETDFKEQKRRL